MCRRPGIPLDFGPQSQTVTLFGIVDACAVHAKAGDATTLYVNSGCMYGSRWGLRGAEDLGGGLSATFMLTAGFAADSGISAQGGRLFGRNSLVGLTSKRYGSLLFGRDNPPTFWLLNDLDPFQGGWGTGLLSTGAPATGSGRVDNSVKYVSPNIGGFAGMLHYGASETTQGRYLGGNLTYKNGPLFVGGAYSRLHTLDANTDKTLTLGAAYDFGFVRPSVAYQRGEWEGTRTAAAPSSPTSLNSRDYHAAFIGANIPVTSTGRVFLSYKAYDDRTAPNFDARQLSAAYLHGLSKRTDLYLAYGSLKNMRASRYSFADASQSYAGATPGSRSTILAVGLKHNF